MTEDHELQKQLIRAMMKRLLGDEMTVASWMNATRYAFANSEGVWRSANETIDAGEYDKVLTLVGMMGGRS
jgi:hypothetical protein